MANPNEAVISCLNNLIETCKDGQDGFRTAAENVRNAEYKTLFNTYSRQRAQFAGELQAEVRRFGEDPETSGSVSASLHRGWINLKSAITGSSDAGIVAECERGEDSAVSNYQNALEDDTLPGDVRSIIERQYRQIQEAHDRVRLQEQRAA